MSSTTYEDAVAAFLARGENFKFAVEISEKLNDAKNKLHRDFWEALLVRLQEILKDYEKKNNWRWKFDQKEKILSWDYGEDNEPYFKLNQELNQIQYFYAYILQGVKSKNDGGLIYYGIGYNEEETEQDESLKEVKALKDALSEKDGYNKWDKWGVLYITEYFAYSNEFLSKVAESKKSIVEIIAKDFWQMFEVNQESIERANQALAKARNKK